MYELNKEICNQLNLNFLYDGADFVQNTRIFKELYSKKVSCVGKLRYNNVEYWAVNGTVEVEKRNIEALKKILEKHYINNYEIVEIDKNKVKCFYKENDNWQSVSLNEYENNHPDANCRNNRLFSCCERKLLTKLSQTCKCGHMYVALQPCSICSYSFEYYKSVEGYTITVHCPNPLSWIDDLK